MTDPTLKKRSTESEKRGLARYAAKVKAERAAEMREVVLGYTASLRP